MIESRSKALFYVLAAYLLAIAFGFVSGFLAFREGIALPWSIVIGDIIGTIFIFCISRSTSNSSFYDPYWSIAPIVVVITLLLNLEEKISIRQIVVSLLVFWWGIRLTFNWVRGWKGLDHQDWRYTDLKRKHGKWYWPVSFLGIHLFPTVLVLGGMLPYLAIFQDSTNKAGWLDLIATIIMAGSIFCEALADYQLRQHRMKGKKSTLTKGIWAYSRHPNYFGEIGFWSGTFLFGLAANMDYYWTCIGAIMMAALFLLISIPMMERRMRMKRKDYAGVQNRISKIFLWPPRD